MFRIDRIDFRTKEQKEITEMVESKIPLAINCRLRVVSYFGDSGEIHARAKMSSSREPIFARARVFRRIVKIRNYSQSKLTGVRHVKFYNR